MDAESLYWETLIPQRPVRRKCFAGWNAALRDAKWWMAAGAEAYISNYGYRELVDDPGSYGYDRSMVPDYATAVINCIFIDIDYTLVIDGENEIIEYRPDINMDVVKMDDWCAANGDLKRKWRFTGGGFHGLIKAEGPASKLDDAVRFIASETHARIDPGSETTATCKRVINSVNRKHGNHVIPVSIDEIRSSTQDKLLQLASMPRDDEFSLGHGTWYFEGVKSSMKKQMDIIGKYSKKIIADSKDATLEKYGLSWNDDFCPALQHLIMKQNPGNDDRRFVIKYLRDVLKIPFVDLVDETKTVINLFINIMENKAKAKHAAVKEKQCIMIYRRKRRFHPYELRLEGLCPEGCAECLEKRNA